MSLWRLRAGQGNLPRSAAKPEGLAVRSPTTATSGGRRGGAGGWCRPRFGGWSRRRGSRGAALETKFFACLLRRCGRGFGWRRLRSRLRLGSSRGFGLRGGSRSRFGGQSRSRFGGRAGVGSGGGCSAVALTIGGGELWPWAVEGAAAVVPMPVPITPVARQVAVAAPQMAASFWAVGPSRPAPVASPGWRAPLALKAAKRSFEVAAWAVSVEDAAKKFGSSGSRANSDHST